MKIVIQCAGTKQKSSLNSGFRTQDNRIVKFVANPALAPIDAKYAYFRPDDLSDNQQTWRTRLLEYNQEASINSLHLLPSYQLYTNKIYTDLVKKFGSRNVFILSAGWGIIPSSFLTPDYDITFSVAKNVAAESRRKKGDTYSDLCLMPDDGETIICLGGKDYLPLFSRLTEKFKGVKKVFYNSNIPPDVPLGFVAARYPTTQKTNWHYSCAADLIEGKVKICVDNL